VAGPNPACRVLEVLLQICRRSNADFRRSLVKSHLQENYPIMPTPGLCRFDLARPSPVVDYRCDNIGIIRTDG
jgi:hypothetical protein